MSKREKLLERLRQNPSHARFEEVDNLLLALGFRKRQRGTIHATYTLGKHRITVPFRKPFILPVYVKRVLQVLDELDETVDVDDVA